jgi:hypothetical protein
MAAQAATKQKEAEAIIQAKIDAEVAMAIMEKRTKYLAVLPSPGPFPAKPQTKTAKAADVDPDGRVPLASGAPKGAKRRKWRIFVTTLTCSRKHLRKWLKPRLRRNQVGTHLKMIHA